MNEVKLNGQGVLELGIHDCSLEDIHRTFGKFTSSDKRPKLFKDLEIYVAELEKTDFVDHLIVNGSFITDKDKPSDIDIIVALRSGVKPKVDWTPSQSNLLSRRFVRKMYGIDIMLDRVNSSEYNIHVEYFIQVKEMPGMMKGLVKLTL